MSEKQGFTGQLKYDFETAANLEIYLPRLKDWFRVTSREFRSFTGKRRINESQYIGPVYNYATNELVDANNFDDTTIAGRDDHQSKLTESEKFRYKF